MAKSIKKIVTEIVKKRKSLMRDECALVLMVCEEMGIDLESRQTFRQAIVKLYETASPLTVHRHKYAAKKK